MAPSGRNANRNRPKKPVSEAYLERAAIHYLGRYASTHANLMKVLERKVRRRNEDNAPATAEQLGWVRAVADNCVEFGYIDDATYAQQRLTGLLRKGKPLRVIAQDLRYKGVPDHIAQATLDNAECDEDRDMDLLAAAAYVRRRRFGAFRRAEYDAAAKLEKEKAAMMRAGFSYSMVLKILSADEDELLSLLR